MNEILIKNWNARVTNADTVYIMGDLFFRYAGNPEDILKQLKGKKHLILGNHDENWVRKVDLKKYFESVSNLLIINTGKAKATLCHFPMMAFEGQYLIHGHVHNSRRADYHEILDKMTNAYNAGTDVNGYMPVTFEELAANSNARKKL